MEKEIKMENIIKIALEYANNFVGTLEEPPNSNRGDTIDKIQKTFGFQGVQYCALFAQYIYKLAFVFSPFPGTASSQTLFEWAKKRNYVSTDFSELQAGDIVIWRRRKLWQGHVGVVMQVNPATQSFITVEGNTSNNDYGNQTDGCGIFQRVRYMKKSDFVVDAFWLRGFIQIRKVLADV